MDSWHCERPAHAIRRFCGRAVAVADTVCCGVCKPQQDPIILPKL